MPNFIVVQGVPGRGMSARVKGRCRGNNVIEGKEKGSAKTVKTALKTHNFDFKLTKF